MLFSLTPRVRLDTQSNGSNRFKDVACFPVSLSLCYVPSPLLTIENEKEVVELAEGVMNNESMTTNTKDVLPPPLAFFFG